MTQELKLATADKFPTYTLRAVSKGDGNGEAIWVSGPGQQDRAVITKNKGTPPTEDQMLSAVSVAGLTAHIELEDWNWIPRVKGKW